MIEADMVAGRRAGLSGQGAGWLPMEDSKRMEEGGLSMRSGAAPRLWVELAIALAALLALAVLTMNVLAMPVQAAWGAGAVMVAVCALILHQWPDPRRGLGPANQVTLGRAVLVALLAGALGAPQWVEAHAVLIAALASVALLLDGVDGWVARRCACASSFGARFDMELDAFLILVLCVHLLVLGKAGPWVLAIGAMRYAFVGAMRPWPWLERPLPERFRRKLVCVWQVASLLVCLLPMVGGGAATALLALALGLLAVSFAVDIHWLYRTRTRHP